jgi:hypothetical protein
MGSIRFRSGQRTRSPMRSSIWFRFTAPTLEAWWMTRGRR